MTLPVWLLVLLLLVSYLWGVVVLRLLRIGWRHDRYAYPAWAWLLGTATVALFMLAWFALSKPLDGQLLPPLLGLAAGAALFFTRRRRLAPLESTAVVGSGSRVEHVLLLLVVVAISGWIIVRLFALNVQPVLYGDEANIFAQRAKALYSTEGLGLDYVIKQAQWDVKHVDYPLFDPLLHAWTYAGAGRITLVDNRWPIQMFTFALLLILAGALRRHVRTGIVAAMLVLFFGMEIFRLNVGPSRALLVLLVGIVATVDAWLRWSETRRSEWWRLFCCAAAAAFWAKNEGSLLLLAFGCALALGWAVRAVPAVMPRPSASWAWLAVPIAIVGLHHGFNRHCGAVNDLMDGEFWDRAWAQLPDRWFEVPAYFWGELICSADKFGLVIPLMLGAAITVPRNAFRSAAFVPLAMVMIALAGYHVIFFGTPFELSWHLPTAADRTVMHTVPIALLGFGMICGAAAPQWFGGRRVAASEVDS